jgi:hypothetical protein
MDDCFSYYVPQTPRDSSRRNSFFRRSSPTLTSFINYIQGVSTRLRNLGKGGDNEDDDSLQLRVSSIEETLGSVHMTVANLEIALGDIVKLLQTKPNPVSAPPQVPSTPPRLQSYSNESSDCYDYSDS